MYELQSPKAPRARHVTTTFQRFQRGMTLGSITFFVVALLAIAAMLITYATIASSLPSPRELDLRAGAFQSVRIYDREGNLLNEAFNTDAGKRISVGINQISPYLKQATIATEDANFYEHSGIDFFALARALYYAVRERGMVSGASTIPQQLVKMLFLTPEQSITRKVKEAFDPTGILGRGNLFEL